MSDGVSANTGPQGFATVLTELLETHGEHRWEEVGPCVWCADCNVRLYQGTLPDDKAPANRAMCQHHNQDWESGLGFYGICEDCGERIWAED